MARHAVLFSLYLCGFVTNIVSAASVNEKDGQKDVNAILGNSTVTPLSVNEKNMNLTQKQDDHTFNQITTSVVSKSMALTSAPKIGSSREPELISANSKTTVPINITKVSISESPHKMDDSKKIDSKDSESEAHTLVIKSSANKTKLDLENEVNDYYSDDKENLKTESKLAKKEFEFEKDKKLESDLTSGDQPSYPIAHGEMDNDKSSHFFAYFLTLMVATIFLYLLFHNKKRILALVLEGRSEQSRRRSNKARYHKLDNNLEEAMSNTKGSNSSLNQVY